MTTQQRDSIISPDPTGEKYLSGHRNLTADNRQPTINTDPRKIAGSPQVVMKCF